VTPDRVLLLALLVLALGWGVWRLWLRWRRGPAEPPASARSGALVPLAPPANDDVLEVAARMILEAYPVNPLAILADLRLDDAIDVRRYGEAALRFEEREHRQELAVAGDIVTVVTNVRDLARTGSQLSFELTSTIRAGLVRGTLRLVRDGDGKLLAMVQDTRTGKLTELLRGVPSGARLGALTATVYGLAHLVSAQDLATKLDGVTAKVDVLLAARSIDQRARLEAVYARAKELGMPPLDAAVEELRGLRHEVRELRYVWRGEVVHALRSLRDPPPVNRLNARFPGTRVRHVAMHDSLREAAGRVAMMEFALRLEHLLAVASGEAEPFLNVLPDELGAWDDMADLLQAKAQTIGYAELTAEPYVEAVRDVVRVYRGGAEALRLGDAPPSQPATT
jgi:hypothetical protein